MHSPPHAHEAVQSFITSVSFPDTRPAVQDMLRKNRDLGPDLLDIDLLLQYKRCFDLSWSAPRWATVDDVMLFYCTKTALTRCQSLARQERQSMHDRRLTSILNRILPLYERYAGTIFACGWVCGPARLFHGDHGHFKSTIFADIDDVHVFEQPLPAHDFAQYVRIGQSTITPLHGSTFAGVQHLLAQCNTLPDYLAAVRPGGVSFRDVDANTWHRISTDPNLRFIDESQVRVYLLDYLLAAIKDPRTPVFKECTCYRNGRPMGRADYCIQVADCWIAVEAKPNVLAEPDLLGQIGQYLSADRFTPTEGARRTTTINAPTAAMCLIVDQSGIYAATARGYIECRPGVPRWTREQLRSVPAADIREWVCARMMDGAK